MRLSLITLLLLLCTACLSQDNLPAEKAPAPPAPATPTPTPVPSYQDRATEIITARLGSVAAEVFRAERLRRNTIGGLLIGFGCLFAIIAAVVMGTSGDD